MKKNTRKKTKKKKKKTKRPKIISRKIKKKKLFQKNKLNAYKTKKTQLPLFLERRAKRAIEISTFRSRVPSLTSFSSICRLWNSLDSHACGFREKALINSSKYGSYGERSLLLVLTELKMAKKLLIC